VRASEVCRRGANACARDCANADANANAEAGTPPVRCADQAKNAKQARNAAHLRRKRISRAAALGVALNPVERPAGWFLLPASVQEVAEVIGLPDAMRLAGAFCPASGGPRRASHSGRAGRIYIPQRPNGDTFKRIADLVGRDAAARLVDVLGGNQVAFPPCTAFTNRIRDESVRKAWRDGTLSAPWIGWLHDITERQVRNITQGEPRPAFDAAGRPLSKNRPPL
ncbi:hypothetical protein, partial [Xanthomonas campestris]